MITNPIKSGLHTIGLASLGTFALLGAHHLGRKQYNPNARFIDYAAGVKQSWFRVIQASKMSKASKSAQSAKSTKSKRLSNPDQLNQHIQTAQSIQTKWVSGVADLKTNQFAVVGINQNRQLVWKTRMPERVHDILVQPVLEHSRARLPQSTRHVTVMGRRPSERFWVLDAATGEIIYHIKAEENRHFYGHACYSLAGDLLYVTENNTHTFEGIIGVYDATLGYKKVQEFNTQGIGPHELLMHPDGETLVVANGGIKTEKASRDELNLDSMQPSLVYLSRHDGTLLEQVFPKHNQMSVRHLSIHKEGHLKGTVAIGIQFQGERHLNVPLVLTHKRGEAEFTPMRLPSHDKKGWHRFHHYIASVVVDSEHHLLCATSPIGGCVGVFDLATGVMIDAIDISDCAGAAVWDFGCDANSYLMSDQATRVPNALNPPADAKFLVSDGQGYLTELTVATDSLPASLTATKPFDMLAECPIKVDKVQHTVAFDNHMQRL